MVSCSLTAIRPPVFMQKHLREYPSPGLNAIVAPTVVDGYQPIDIPSTVVVDIAAMSGAHLGSFIGPLVVGVAAMVVDVNALAIGNVICGISYPPML